jgi:hypothetical protein
LSVVEKVLLILDYATMPGKPPHNAPLSQWTQYLPKFAQRVGQIAQHYGTLIDAYEVSSPICMCVYWLIGLDEWHDKDMEWRGSYESCM